MRLGRALLACLLALSLAGCWSKRELVDVSFAGSLAVDWEDGEYLVSVNILSPRESAGKERGGGGGNSQQAVWTLSAKGRGLDDALARVDQMLSRSLTMAHVRTVIFGEEMARHGIGPALDFLIRSVEVRPTAWIGVTPGRGADLMNARPRQEMSPAEGPMGYHDAAQRRSSITPALRLTNVANILQEEGVDLTLPLFRLGNTPLPAPDGEIQPNAEYAQEVVFGGAGVFRDDKLVAWLSPRVARGQLWVAGLAIHGAISVPCKDPSERAVFRLRSNKGKAETTVEGGRVRSHITVKVVADANEVGCSEQLLVHGDISRLEELLAKEVKREIMDVVTVSRESEADLLGLGQSLFRTDAAAFHRLEPWGKTLSTLPVTVEVSAQVVRLGQTNKRFRIERN